MTLTIESMKGPEAKLLYGHVLEELGKSLPGGKDKVKGKCTMPPTLLNQEMGYLER
jgi:hypothetical protein